MTRRSRLSRMCPPGSGAFQIARSVWILSGDAPGAPLTAHGQERHVVPLAAGAAPERVLVQAFYQPLEGLSARAVERPLDRFQVVQRVVSSNLDQSVGKEEKLIPR